MANLRDIRRRIKSIKNTSQITKAMQMVAASRMRRAQLQALAGRPYTSLLNEIAANLEAGSGEISHPLLEKRPVKKTAVLVISTDKGLCGGLNTNLLRDVMKNDGPNKAYVSVGRKGRQFLTRLQKELLADFELKENFTFRDSKVISHFLLNQFMEGKIDAVEVYYTHYISVINQKPTRIELLPIGQGSLPHVPTDEKKKGGDGTHYIYEPNAEELLGHLLPFYVHMEVYQAALDARASEHSSRMVAMKNATDNAKQIIKDLTLDYNKARQAGITKELLEISSAQAALN